MTNETEVGTRSPVPRSAFKKSQLAFRAALAASLSLVIGGLVHLHQPIYALVASIVVIDPSAAKTRRLGAIQLAATAIGAVCGGVMSAFLPESPWIVGAGTLVAMLVCIFIGAAEAARVAGYVCGIILIQHGDNALKYSLGRFAETALGVIMAWGVSAVPTWFRGDRAALILTQAERRPS